MQLLSIEIKNYKSLGNILFKPTPFSVVIGPNAAGKSNFANALSFLKEVYEYDLETAIRRKGGYENIALRRKRRSTSPVEFSVFIKVTKEDNNINLILGKDLLKDYLVKHSFAFKAYGQRIKSDFAVVSEELIIYENYIDESNNDILLRVHRTEEKIQKPFVKKDHPLFKEFKFLINYFDESRIIKNISPQQLWINRRSLGVFNELPMLIKTWAIYQFSPKNVRLSGIPTPNPVITEFGENLPALVDWLINNSKEGWEEILSTMQTIIPKLTNITTDFLHNKTLGLFFYEEGIGRPWNSDEVSDGTILTLSVLCVIADPRNSLILIEEPENSLHPWILRVLIEKLKVISKDKNIIVTTHSPILIDMVSPNEIWCIAKKNSQTTLKRLTDLSKDLEDGWKNGDYKISEFLDSGLIPQLTPAPEI